MGKEKEKRNIFDEAKLHADKKRKKEFLRQKKIKNAPAKKENISEPEKLQDVEHKEDKEIEVILERAKKLREDLDLRLDELLKLKDQLPKPIADMLDDMSKMPEEHQKILIEKTNELVGHINTIVPNPIDPSTKKVEKDELKRGRKSQKLRGKKGWISM